MDSHLSSRSLSKSGFQRYPQSLSALKVDSINTQSIQSHSPVSPSKLHTRRRNTNHKRSSSSTAVDPLTTVSSPTVVSSLAQSQHTEHKKTLPHPNGGDVSVTSNDKRSDIDSLVEHVRAIAMESNRPNTPGTHIDWAGDDHDSLPDLDDWGVSSKTLNESCDSALNSSQDTEVSESSPVIKSTNEYDERDSVAPDNNKVLDTPSVDPIAPASSAPSLDAAMSALSNALDECKRDSRQDSTRDNTRERKRERGRGKDRERREKITVNSPKKSLIDRISSPTRPDSTPLRINESKSSSLPHHPSLPPKPLTNPFDSVSLSRINGNANLPPRTGYSWRAPRVDKSPLRESVAVSGSISTAQTELRNAPVTQSSLDTPEEPNETHTDWSSTHASTDNDAEEQADKSSAAEPPTSLSNTDIAQVEVEPPTPQEELPAESGQVQSALISHSSPRTRTQRPLSSDVTPYVRRDRSPYKMHNSRNHSVPHFGSDSSSPYGGVNRTRAPHATRPIIQLNALAMISRSLRESPTPPRRESPAPLVPVSSAN